MSYIVMECHSSYAILLDEEGRFLKAANLHYQVGQRVYDPVLMKEKPEKRFRPVRWAAGGAAVIAAGFLLVFGINYYQNHLMSYSSIYLTINPEIRMSLNRLGEVLELKGTNQDGEILLDGYDGKGKDKVTVTDELIDRAIEMGFLSEGGQVSFSIDTPEEALLQEYGEELETEVKQHLKNRISITIEIVDYHTGDRETSYTETPAREEEVQSQPAAETGQEQTPAAAQEETPAIQAETPDSSTQTQNDSSNTQPSQSQGTAAYEDTDYGTDSDGEAGYSQPEPQAPQTTEGVSDYEDSSDYGDSGYEEEDD